MAKKNIEKPKRKPTKRQLSSWQKQNKRRRIIIALGTTVITIVLALVTCGLYFQWYVPEQKPLKETVVEINDVSFNMQYYIDAVDFHLGENTQYVRYFLDYILEVVQQNELIRQEAEELGFTISDEEVKELIKENEYDNTQATRDAIRASLLVEKMKEEYFDPMLPASAEHRDVMAMFLESEQQAAEVKERLEAGENFAEIAAELSLESKTKESSGGLGWLPEGILDGLVSSTILEENIFSGPVGVLSQPLFEEEKEKEVGYWFLKVTERNNEEEDGEAYVQVILLPSEEKAQEALARLNNGEDFAELAEEVSQYGEEGDRADMGWVVSGDKSEAFEAYVFGEDTELDVISGIIKDEEVITTGGYWLFEVAGSEVRDYSDDDRETFIAEYLEEWALSIKEDPDNVITSYLDEDLKSFAVRKITG